MDLPITTGEAARLLETLEVRLNDLVRRGKVRPAPRVVAGRRAWEEMHVRQAARALGITDIERRLAEEVA